MIRDTRGQIAAASALLVTIMILVAGALLPLMGTGALLLLGGFAASHFLAGRLYRPVEKLAVDSAENLAQRERAEAALELTSGELQLAARFSADAAHQRGRIGIQGVVHDRWI